MAIGKGCFRLGVRESETVKVKMTNRQAKELLEEGKTVKVQVKGCGVKSLGVKLRRSAVKKKHKRHRRAGGSLSSASRVR